MGSFLKFHYENEHALFGGDSLDNIYKYMYNLNYSLKVTYFAFVNFKNLHQCC